MGCHVIVIDSAMFIVIDSAMFIVIDRPWVWSVRVDMKERRKDEYTLDGQSERG